MSNQDNGAPSLEATWTKVNDGWAVRVYGSAEDLTGQTVTVTSKQGKTSQVLLHELIEERGSSIRFYSVGERK